MLIPTAINNLTIENAQEASINYHGIRFCGRIQVDFEESTNQYAGGYITLMCIPNDQIIIPSINSEAKLNDSQSFVIAVIPYQMHIDTTENAAGYGSTFDFNIVPNTSRTCINGGKILGQVQNDSPTADVVYTGILSAFTVMI